MRLIDADKFDKYVRTKLGSMAEYELFATMIDNQPTAYDVNKVWDEITDRAGRATTKSAYKTYWECAKIVKGVVKDE